MGKRGPRATSGKDKVVSIRMNTTLRSRLDRAAEASGRKLSSEIEHRLAASFAEDDMSTAMFGSSRNHAIAKLIVMVMDLAGDRRRAGDWTTDSVQFTRGFAGVALLLG